MIHMTQMLSLSAIIFSISLIGMMINKNNLLKLLMCIELMLLAVNINFVTFSQYLHLAAGEVFVFFVLTVAAAESAIGLAIIVLLYRQNGKLTTTIINKLKG